LFVSGFVSIDHALNFSLRILSRSHAANGFSTLAGIQRRQRQGLNFSNQLSLNNVVAASEMDPAQPSCNRSGNYVTITHSRLPFSVNCDAHFTTRCGNYIDRYRCRS
jgi:hypothetical protein